MEGDENKKTNCKKYVFIGKHRLSLQGAYMFIKHLKGV